MEAYNSSKVGERVRISSPAPTEDEQKLKSKYDIAAKKIRDTKGGSQAEAEFVQAYQALVKAGLAQQLKGKYRAR